ncbi:MAG TPA: hypothetical protein DCY55_04865 [Gammaproteobacteria bacterium]|nr:hypothetical protein [Gammaproteobacteria bacterium]
MHLALHFLVPLSLAVLFYRPTWSISFAVMLAGLLIDIDHLWANPIYDPSRCSIGFHPLHTVLPITFYCLALFHPKTRVLGIGLLVHIFLDSLDCRILSGIWYTNY